MNVKELTLYNFRNFTNLKLSLSPGVNIFLGNNGQGKTNLLESIYLIAKGQSFRPSQVSTFINKDTHNPLKQALAKAKIEKQSTDNELKLQLQDNKKALFVNNKRVSSKQVFQQYPVILFSPESLAAIKEGPDQRRQLVDEWLVVSDFGNARLINDFKKCLKTRSKVLRDFKKGFINYPRFEALIAPLNEIYFPIAIMMTIARINALKDILDDFQTAMKFIMNDENVEISVDYLMSDTSIMQWSEDELLKFMMQRATQLTRAEQDSGITLIGPHKHDIKFLMSGEDSRYFCSQGQQRALILSFKMAQIINHFRVYNDYPLLLLDDVLSELDQEKRTRLIEFLKGIDSQIFLTTTDLAFDVSELNEDVAVFKINSGQVTPDN